MPRYLFTWHGYGTWWLDDRRCYVYRTRGLQRSEDRMGWRYRQSQREPSVRFTPAMQACMLQTRRAAEESVDITVHGIACTPTHMHALVSWRHDRGWKSLRGALQSAMTRQLNDRFGRRTWFAENASRKRVGDRGHVDDRLVAYLPEHPGEQWFRPRDVERAHADPKQSPGGYLALGCERYGLGRCISAMSISTVCSLARLASPTVTRVGRPALRLNLPSWVRRA